MQEIFDKLKKRIMICATEACGYTPLTRVVSEAELKDIIEQIAAEYSNGHFGCNTNGEHEKCNGCGLTDCKNRNKIWFGVSDDNNGWISCNERLPEPIRPVLVTLRNWMNDKYFVRVGRFHTDHWKTDEGIVENSVVIAWQPLPQPYQPKGE